jgi:hypothetical protein
MITNFQKYSLLEKQASNLVKYMPLPFVKILHEEYGILPTVKITPIDPDKVKNDYTKLREILKSFRVLYCNPTKDYYVMLHDPAHNQIGSVVFSKGAINRDKTSTYNRLDRLGYLTPKLSEDPNGTFYYMAHAVKREKKDGEPDENKIKGKELLIDLIKEFDAKYSQLFRAWWIKNYNELTEVIKDKVNKLSYNDINRNVYFEKLIEDQKKIRNYINNPTHTAHFYIPYDAKTEEKKMEAYYKEHILIKVMAKKSGGSNDTYINWDYQDYNKIINFLDTIGGKNRLLTLSAIALYKNQKSEINYLNNKYWDKKIAEDPQFIKDIKAKLDKNTDIEKGLGNYDPDLIDKYGAGFTAVDFNMFEKIKKL